MSEYQYVGFRAVDGPVSEENLRYMERQSSRAKITPWTFDNEYHYGDFRGNALEMLRRGYDFHLHYANYGIRTLYIRLPAGFPDPNAAQPYLGKEGLRYVAEKDGPGGTLVIEPNYESGELDSLWDFDQWVAKLIGLRNEILAGDLRPLYLAHLAVALDDNHDPETTREGPAPAGLGKPTASQAALAEFYEIDEGLLAAAAEASPRAPAMEDPRKHYSDWLQLRSSTEKDRWLLELLSDPGASVRNTMLMQFRQSQAVPSWPVARVGRTMEQLEELADVHREAAEAKAAAREQALQQQRFKEIAADPKQYLKQADDLVKQRSTTSYAEAARLLAEVRRALVDAGKKDLAGPHAAKLKAANPTLNHLRAALRREGLL